MTAIDSRLSFASYISLPDLQALREMGISVEPEHIWAEDPLKISVSEDGVLLVLHYADTCVRPPLVEILVLENGATTADLESALTKLRTVQQYFQDHLVECRLEVGL